MSGGPSRHCLLVDWGTSSLRGAVLDAAGQVLERSSAPLGIQFTGGRPFADIFAEAFGPWFARYPGMGALAAGMIGSRQGWAEAPYVPCPAAFEDLGRAIRYVDTGGFGRLGIVPGVSADPGGVPDVMRGEEVQVFGVLPSPDARCSVLLPGTHSKWVDVEAGRIADFRTFMTGEVFGLLREHSILGRTMSIDDARPLDAAAFDAGCAASLESGGTLLHALFGVRTLGLFDRLAGEAAPDYLSGLLIGEEVREALLDRPVASGAIHLVGRGDLAERYARALAAAGVTALPADGDSGLRGMHRLAVASGLMEDTGA